jgi:mono/diheme cytochrome c family protein
MKIAWLLLAALGVAAPGQRAAQTPTGVRPSEGRELYLDYCSSCHGLQGKGDGPAGPTLKERPPDLTRLSAKMKGQFPKAYVRETIVSGRAAHGSPDMPTWGPIFREVEGAREAGERVNDLVRYLEQIQVR